MRKIDVTIALVNYKTPDLLIACIRSVKRHTKDLLYEVIVLDNASGDDSLMRVKREFPDIKTIQSRRNLFATGGNNEIFKQANGEYFLVLNPDMEFSDNSILIMKKFLDENKTVAAVSCRQYYKNGRLQYTASRFPTPLIEFWENNMIGRFFQNKEVLQKFRYKGWDRKDIRVVEMIPDTIMLIRSSVGEKLGMYDRHIKLMYMENDLCLRIKELGYSVCHVGSASVLHHVGQSTRQLPNRELFKIYQEDRLYYYKKHFGVPWMIFLQITFQINYFYYLLEPMITVFKRKPTNRFV